MKNRFRILLWPLIALLIYLTVQALSAIPTGVVQYLSPDSDPTQWMAISLLASSIVTGIALMLIPQFGLSNSFKNTGCDSVSTLIALFATLFSLLAFDIVNEQLDLPNIAEEIFVGMSSSVWGMLAIGIFGPICEEIVFRGGLMKPMLDRGANPWVAILLSAIVFGLVHGNPAQIPFAAMVGVVFGIIYYRTQSLVITSLCHILNNSASVVLMNIYGEETDELTFENMLGTTGMWVTMAAAALAAAYLLWVFWKRTECKVEEE